ncbi:hypothetical protein IX91_19160 [Vibrio tubiashii ATCC 19109]|uniref:Uncharacterized protein n=1 Tax=Vibrio tubiashii ATCC 19109 TaxID=1051646 RepID=A0A0A0SI54_9VIBR|nr:hypothetical protein IX91_19160 [Vibrio tubiashii ATCC 19109]
MIFKLIVILLVFTNRRKGIEQINCIKTEKIINSFDVRLDKKRANSDGNWLLGRRLDGLTVEQI